MKTKKQIHKKVRQAEKMIKSGQTDVAIQLLTKHLDKDKGDVDALNMLGEIYLEQQNYEKAFTTYAQSLKAQPVNPTAWRNVGFIQYTAMKNDHAALNSFSNAVSQDPDDGISYFYLGLISNQLNQPRDAESLLEMAVEKTPHHVEALSTLGMVKVRLHKFEEGKPYVLSALKAAPQNMLVFQNALNLESLLTLSQTEEKIIEQAITTNKDNPAFTEMIVLRKAERLLDKKLYQDVLETLDSLEIDENNIQAQRTKADILARTHHKLGDYDTAFDFFKKANSINAKDPQKALLSLQTFPAVIAQNKRCLTPDFVTKLTSDLAKQPTPPYPSPIFVTGFPRSGTTLTGQILDAHPNLVTADERGALDQIILHAHQQWGYKFANDIPSLTHDQIRQCHTWFDEFQDHIPSTQTQRSFIDKMPFNMIYGALILKLFPKAKIIHVQRHPLDAILSAYMQQFNLNAATIHFLTLENTANLYRQMQNVWDLQKRLLPLSVHEVRYEDMVSDFKGEVTKMLDFLSQEWHDDILNFHARQSSQAPSSLTPSRTQVNQAINTSSIGRWKYYKKHLKPIIEPLSDTIESLGYDID